MFSGIPLQPLSMQSWPTFVRIHHRNYMFYLFSYLQGATMPNPTPRFFSDTSSKPASSPTDQKTTLKQQLEDAYLRNQLTGFSLDHPPYRAKQTNDLIESCKKSGLTDNLWYLGLEFLTTCRAWTEAPRNNVFSEGNPGVNQIDWSEQVTRFFAYWENLPGKKSQHPTQPSDSLKLIVTAAVLLSLPHGLEVIAERTPDEVIATAEKLGTPHTFTNAGLVDGSVLNSLKTLIKNLLTEKRIAEIDSEWQPKMQLAQADVNAFLAKSTCCLIL